MRKLVSLILAASLVFLGNIQPKADDNVAQATNLAVDTELLTEVDSGATTAEASAEAADKTSEAATTDTSSKPTDGGAVGTTEPTNETVGTTEPTDETVGTTEAELSPDEELVKPATQAAAPDAGDLAALADQVEPGKIADRATQADPTTPDQLDVHNDAEGQTLEVYRTETQSASFRIINPNSAGTVKLRSLKITDPADASAKGLSLVGADGANAEFEGASDGLKDVPATPMLSYKLNMQAPALSAEPYNAVSSEAVTVTVTDSNGTQQTLNFNFEIKPLTAKYTPQAKAGVKVKQNAEIKPENLIDSTGLPSGLRYAFKGDVPTTATVGTVNANVEVTYADKSSDVVAVSFTVEAAPPTPTKHTVKFDSDSGTAIADVQVEHNQQVAEPSPAPTKTGYTFVCWNKDGAQYDFTQPVTADMTLKASWEVNEYRITFKFENGKTADVIKTARHGEALRDKPADPSRAGYKFKGWYKQLTDSSAFDLSTPITSEFTLHAKWEVEEVKPLPRPPYIPDDDDWYYYRRDVELLEQSSISYRYQSYEPLEFRFAASPYDLDFVKIDGYYVDRSDYEVYRGSTIISLNPSFLNRLARGRHTLTVGFERTRRGLNVGHASFYVLGKRTTLKPGQVGKTGEIPAHSGELALLLNVLAIALYSRRRFGKK